MELKGTVDGYGFIDERNKAYLEKQRDEGLGFDFESVLANVEDKVVGQREQIRQIVEYLCLWFARYSAIVKGVEEDSLPRLSSQLLLGPTASGKTYIVRTLCDALSLPLTVVNSSALTGAGWRGMSIDSVLYGVAKEQIANPDGVQVVLFDEFDKVRLDQRTQQECASFNVQPDLLKVLEGGIYHGEADDHTVFELDTNKVIFLLAGAFTGLGKRYVAPRLRKEAFSFGEVEDSKLSEIAYSEDEDLLRTQVAVVDFLHWGIMSELTGRIGSIVALPALTEDQMVDIVNNSTRSLQNRFSALMPAQVNLVIDDDAARKLAKDAIDSGLGARALEGSVAPLIAHATRECYADASVLQVVITLDDEGSLHVRLDRSNERTDNREGE